VNRVSETPEDPPRSARISLQAAQDALAKDTLKDPSIRGYSDLGRFGNESGKYVRPYVTFPFFFFWMLRWISHAEDEFRIPPKIRFACCGFLRHDSLPQTRVLTTKLNPARSRSLNVRIFPSSHFDIRDIIAIQSPISRYISRCSSIKYRL
jgi:hypothetical protein